MPRLVLQGEELGLVEALGDEADALIGPHHLHQALDRQLLLEHTLDHPELSFDLLPPLLRQVALLQYLIENLALGFDVVDLEGFFQRVELHEVLTLDLLVGKVVLRLADGQVDREAAFRVFIALIILTILVLLCTL